MILQKSKFRFSHWFLHGPYNSAKLDDLPVQVNPFPVYPGWQVQVKLPTVLVQLASALQPPLFVEHSSTSAVSANKFQQLIINETVLLLN